MIDESEESQTFNYKQKLKKSPLSKTDKWDFFNFFAIYA